MIRAVPETTSATGTGTPQDRIARHQHAAHVLRARGVMAIACLMWLVVGGGLDLTCHGAIGRGSLAFILAVRLAATAHHLVVLGTMWRTPLPSPKITGALMASLFPVTSLSLTIIATRMGGITSPYAVAFPVIIMVQALAMPDHWRRSAPLVALTALIYPAGILATAMFDDTIRAQLSDRAAMTYFATYVGTLFAGCVVVGWGGHLVWSLRRSVFESRSLGRYKLERRIGKGGMGEVWRAQDRAQRREVALKILSPEHGKQPAAIARFEREIQATAHLDHPNIVRVYDWGVTVDGVWYYAMELLDGTDLSSLVKRNGALPPAFAVHLGIEAARAVAEAHARGIVHRDLKPANVILTSDERVKVLDFGVARFGDDDGGITLAGAVVGTPGFIAPEVIAGASGGMPADVYGLAATLFALITDQTPRDAGPGVPPSAIAKGIPADLDAILVRALDADPSRRPQTCGELAQALASCSLAGTWTGGFQGELTPATPVDVAHDATLDNGPPTSADGPVGRQRSGGR